LSQRKKRGVCWLLVISVRKRNCSCAKYCHLHQAVGTHGPSVAPPSFRRLDQTNQHLSSRGSDNRRQNSLVSLFNQITMLARSCPGYLGYPFEKSRDCTRKIPLSHCHDEEIDTLARNIENRQANVQRRVTQIPRQPSRGMRRSPRFLDRNGTGHAIPLIRPPHSTKPASLTLCECPPAV
jgi:hypothetical protein